MITRVLYGQHHQGPMPHIVGHLPKTQPKETHPNSLPSSQKWEKVWSRTNGLVYFYNKPTHTNKWTKPEYLKVSLIYFC